MTSSSNGLSRLKEILQNDLSPSDFEKLVAALLSQHLGLGISVAKSGFQHGGDAGPAGRQGRRFRIEAKRYSDTTRLSSRELLGEVDHALSCDPALEAWFLVATRSVPEQLGNDLMRKSDDVGVPIVIIDWSKHEFPSLAALCTTSPEVMETHATKEAAQIVRNLAQDAMDSLSILDKDLKTWQLGYERIRSMSLESLSEIWNDPRKSTAALGQNAAGGSKTTTISRPRVEASFAQWWDGNAQQDAPAAVVGSQGVGKTWSTLQWLVTESHLQPIVLWIPSSAFATLQGVSKSAIKQLLGERLYEMTNARTSEHWKLRLDRLLLRPVEEGPVVTLVLDGLNQAPSVPWSDVLKVLQDPDFAGRIRVVIITRNMHFSDRLSELRDLVIAPEIIEVEEYDLDDGGELDQRLAAEGLERASLHEDLILLARIPRLFDLVIAVRERLVDAEQITLHRVLWEYGRDTFGARANASFGEKEWRSWLAKVAQNHLNGMSDYDLQSLGGMVQRPDLEPNVVYRRLSEIVDSDFVSNSSGNKIQLSFDLVAHALGAALLDHLEASAANRDEIDTKLANWLDPIAGLDEKAEILRASISISLEAANIADESTLSALVFEWLTAQNVPEVHRSELSRIAVPLCGALLGVVEHASGPALSAARLLAVNTLRTISRSDLASLDKIVTQCSSWLKVVSRDVQPQNRRSEEGEKHRVQRLLDRVGTYEDGERQIVGQTITFVERKPHDFEKYIASLLEGFPLLAAIPVFEAAAISSSICQNENYWDALKWLCLLNEVDFEATSAALGSNAKEIAGKPSEAGVHADLPKRVAALLLWLSGDEENEAEAMLLNPPLDQFLTYEKHYLADPGKSFLTLEMRHVNEVLENTTLPLWKRADKAQKFFLDSNFSPPESFCDEICTWVSSTEMESLDTALGSTPADANWDRMVPALARCAPILMCERLREKILSLSKRPSEQRYVSAIRAPRQFLLSQGNFRHAAADLQEADSSLDGDHEGYVSTQLLLLQLEGLSPEGKFTRIIDADLDAIFTCLFPVLDDLPGSETDTLVGRYRTGSPREKDHLISLLSLTNPELGGASWAWLVELSEDQKFSNRGHVFEILWRFDEKRLGRHLLKQEWHWEHSENKFCNHYGSLALAAAGVELPFEQILSSIAPWLIPKALKKHGATADKTKAAASILMSLLDISTTDAPDLGSDISVKDETRKRNPFAFTLSVRPENPDDPIAQFRDSFDTQKSLERRNQAVEVATDRLIAARAAGANLMLHSFKPNDFEAFIAYAPDAIESWLEGHEGPSEDFQRRVRLAEGFYIALCEGLLANSHAKGENLWRSLRETLTTRFVGDFGVEQLVHMAFRIQNAPDALRRELFDLKNANSDKKLFDLVLASTSNDQTQWLSQFISEDEQSGVTWRIQRARVINGLLLPDNTTAEVPWAEGQVESLQMARDREATTRMRDAVFAHHWWQQYWEAESDERAYAAWELLLRCADRRAYLWMSFTSKEVDTSGSQKNRRIAHFRINFAQLKSAIKKKEEGLGKTFLGRKVVGGVGPWNMH